MGDKYYDAPNPKWGINILKPEDKNYNYKVKRPLTFPLFPQDDPKECNFWLNEDPPLKVAPWPKNCLIY